MLNFNFNESGIGSKMKVGEVRFNIRNFDILKKKKKDFDYS